MPAYNSITPEKLSRLIGRPDCPVLIDVCIDDDFSCDPRLIPGSKRRPYDRVSDWVHEIDGESAVVICQKGLKLSQGVAALLRHEGVAAETLEGGAVGWANLNLPMVPYNKLPARNAKGATVWVTRSRPKVDRIACPWLIRRFIDPDAVFLFVNPSDVMGVADRFQATPFDIEGEGVFWSHRGELCTFDVMVDEFGLSGIPALRTLAKIVRGADTGRLDLTPESPGLLAASLGLSRMYADDLSQLDAGLGLYDAFFRWCRDAMDETHNWPSHLPREERVAAGRMKP